MTEPGRSGAPPIEPEQATGRVPEQAGGVGPAASVEQWSRPSTRLATMRRVELGVATVVALAVGAGLGGVLIGPTVAGGAGAGVLVLAGALDVFLQRRVRSWGYLERSEDLLVRRGVLVRRLSVVPYGRMQFVDVTSGLAERSFGLSTARLHTAAAASDARIPGLAATEATRLRDRLAALGEAKAAGL